MLTKRQTAIFKTIVDEFTRTAEPVGSKKLMDLLDFNCSSATIRNEMAALEDLGLLEKHIPPAVVYQAVAVIGSMLKI